MSKRARFSPNLFRIMPTLVVVMGAILVQTLGVTDSLDRRFQDALIRIQPASSLTPPSALPDVAVVTIDPRSLRAYDDWPWPRGRHADAVDRLGAAGARTIAFDIDFSSASTASEDTRLAESLRDNGRVVLATFSQFQAVENGAELEIVNRPIAALEEAAAAVGSVLVPIDADGVVRRAPRTSSIHGEPTPSLARAALAVASKRERTHAALAAEGSTLIDFRRAEPSFPILPYADLLSGRFDSEILRDRVVFVGATAAEFQDLWATPIAPALPGVVIQAIAYRTAAAEAAGERVLSSAPPGWIFALYLSLGLALLPRSGSNRLRRLGRFLGASIGLVFVAWFSLWEWGVVLPASTALLLIASQYALGIESLQKRIQQRVAAQESSLSALARLGDATADTPNAAGARGTQNTRGLELALELLGEVVDARGVILLRATPTGRLTRERLEWRPAQARTMSSSWTSRAPKWHCRSAARGR
jgi:CHASE2 domain-containing sensor protein